MEDPKKNLIKDIKKIEETITNPIKFGIPSWMVNRRKDTETGEDRHLVGTDLKFMQEQDIKRVIRIKSYK